MVRFRRNGERAECGLDEALATDDPLVREWMAEDARFGGEFGE
jgi:hypothetical protein